jgi:hypothetical protein
LSEEINENIKEKFEQIKEAIEYNLIFQENGPSINKLSVAKENINYLEYQFYKLRNKRCFRRLKIENDYFECVFSINDEIKKHKNCETKEEVIKWLEGAHKKALNEPFEKCGEFIISIIRMRFNYETKKYEDVRENYY